MILLAETLADFERHVLSEYPKEACGLVMANRYIPMLNAARDPLTQFRIEPTDYVQAAQLGPIQAVLHSHPYNLSKPPKHPPEWPSSHDLRGWMDNNIPWGICATDGSGISQLVWLDENNPQPLLGREFIHGINDCYSLIRDYYRLERGITLMNFARGMDWWDSGENLYDDNFERAGFYSVPFEEATVGDCVLMKIRSPVTNHAGVITGPNEILHHLFHRLSGKDSLSRWSKVINRVVRYGRNQ